MSKKYHLKNIHALLVNGFSEEELRQLSYYEAEFKPAYSQLAQNISRDEIARRLIEYAEQKMLLDNLLTLAKKHNPARFDEHQPYYHSTTVPQKPTVLVVEDDADVVLFIADNLEYLDYKVLIARNGLEGLEKARQEKPQLIILDVMMPIMDGHEVCRHLKTDADTRQIPILMLTAKGQAHDKAMGINLGADDYLAKPYDKAEFEARVKALLRRFYDSRLN